MFLVILLAFVVIFLMVSVQYRKGTTKGLIVSFLFISSCASMLQNKGQVYCGQSFYFNEEAFEKRWQDIENRLRDWHSQRYNGASNFGYSIQMGQYKINNDKGGERKMEDLNSLVASVGSAITAIYVLVKTILGIIAKTKKN